MRQIIDASPTRIYTRDRIGRFTMANKATADFYGVPLDDLIGRHLSELQPDEDTVERSLAEDREVTRLGGTVYRHGRGGPEAMDLTTRVLARMAATLREHQVLTFRAVATSAIRDAENQTEFLERARRALGGVAVDVISGQEEARLIQLGVHTRSPGSGEKRKG